MTDSPMPERICPEHHCTMSPRGTGYWCHLCSLQRGVDQAEAGDLVWGLGPFHPCCDVCDEELCEPGALLFGPPDVDSLAKKEHLCVGCYALVQTAMARIKMSLTSATMAKPDLDAPL